MTTTLMQTPRLQFFTASGVPLSGGKLYTYATGTTTPQATYTDSTGSTPNANPIILDSRGECNCWTGALLYKMVLRDANNALIWTVDPVGAEVTLAALAASSGSSLVGFIQRGADATTRTAQSKMRDLISVFDYMTQTEIDDIISHTGSIDVTAKMNKAFSDAATLGAGVYAPDGTYQVGNLLFGNQNAGGQSTAPTGLYGSSKQGTIFKAATGTTGTIFKGWSLAGVQLRDFYIYSVGTKAQALDLRWFINGVSTQNVLSDIRIDAGVDGNGDFAPIIADLTNFGDSSEITNVIVNGVNHSQCGLDVNIPGGFAPISNCVWNGCWLQIAMQNANIKNSWGMGIRLGANCAMYAMFDTCYLYNNTWSDSIIWSESTATSQSVKALIVNNTLMVGGGTASSYLNINAVSKLEFYGCQFTTPAYANQTPMFGANCITRDTYWAPKVLFQGGSLENDTATCFNLPAAASGWILEFDNFMNAFTAYPYPNKRSSIYAQGGATGTFTAATWYTLIPEGTLEAGSYIVTFSWNHNNTGGVPYILVASALITMAYPTSGTLNTGANIATVICEHELGRLTTITYRMNKIAGAPVTPSLQFNCNTTLNAPGSYTWTAVKIANN